MDHGVRITGPTRGWWGMACWNGLSVDQQRRLIERGNLGFGYQPEGDCPYPAEVCVETMYDEAPGPRFYCRHCVMAFLLLTYLRDDNQRTDLES